MSTIKNPVGPEDPSVYWRRRAAVGVGLLVVLWLAWWLLQAAFGSDDEPDPAQPSPSSSLGPSASPSAQSSASSAPASSAMSSAGSSPTPSASLANCADSDFAVVAAANGTSTGVGDGLVVTMTVTNTGDSACRRDVGAGANEITITSGSVLVWSSDFCNPSTRTDMAVLGPGEEFSTSVTWPGTVTEESCPANQPAAQPGTYRTVARNGSARSDPVVFTVQQ